MSQDELRYLIALPLLQEVGAKRAKDLIREFGSAQTVFSLKTSDLLEHTHLGKVQIELMMASRSQALKRADLELEFIHKHQIDTFYIDDDNYSYRLRECVDAPLLLYGKGNITLNEGHFLSVVGTRMPTDRGKELCRTIILQLAQSVPNLTIVSGLAYGIDVTAHRAAIEAGLPTIIIPGHGLDRIYPAVHRRTAIESLERGGILTEFMSATTPERPNFIARNRIIAGLSDATLVVESKEKGGSLITADMASSYGRDVLAVPGRPTDDRSAGCNRLIKQRKAELVGNAEDIVMALQWDAYQSKDKPVQTELFADCTAEEQAVLNLLRQEEEGLHVNQLVMKLARPYSEVSAMLTMMEFRGLVKSLPGGMYRALC